MDLLTWGSEQNWIGFSVWSDTVSGSTDANMWIFIYFELHVGREMRTCEIFIGFSMVCVTP